MRNHILFLSFFLLFSHSVNSLTLSNTLGSNMVLQREPASAVVWGWDSANARITVSFGSYTGSTTAQADGSFSIKLPPTAAGGPYTITVTSSAGGSEKLDNVLFGDVYLCSGQSNMQMTVASAFNASTEIAKAANYPQIRLFSVGQGSTSDKEENQLLSIDLRWSVASPAVVGANAWGHFSAVCWFFGKELADYDPKLPVGLVSTNWGGTIVQAWSSTDALKKCQKNTDAIITTAPVSKLYAGPDPNTPSVLWNAMIVPFLHMQVKGALWYQGESNAGDPNGYKCQFPAMIEDWRAKFGQSLPFYFVQLSPWQVGGGSVSIAQTRDAQLAALALPQVGFATAADLGDISSPDGSIHPRNKQDVAKRLLLQARAITYGDKNVVYEGPMFVSARTVSQAPNVAVQITLAAEGTKSGLKIVPTGPCPVSAVECSWAEIILSDGKSYNATISIQGSTVVFSYNGAPAGTTVKAVSYGFQSWPMMSVYNEGGLPLIPFYEPVSARKQHIFSPLRF